MQTVGYREYIDQVAAEFPAVDKEAVAKVVMHGLVMLGSFRKNNHDIYLNHNNKKFYFYFGDIATTPKQLQRLYEEKMRRKSRAVYRLRKTKYDGYYYFGLSTQDYEKHTKGELIGRVHLHKIYDETKLYNIATYFFKIAIEEDNGWLMLEENYDTTNAILVETSYKITNEKDLTEHV